MTNSYFEYISVPLLIVYRTGVEEQYSERNHLLTELREVYQSSLEKKCQTASAKEREKDDLEMAKNMWQASLETYAKTKATQCIS